MTRHAAIDVGSNSVRLLIAEVDRRGRATRLHADREVVRLGTGVFRSGRLSQSSMADALAALDRMAVAIRAHRVSRVRAVGTSALRDASNRATFVRDATAVVGVPLEVIGGLEEARLVEAGVRARWPHPGERVVIVDLGGGSAQLILGGRHTSIEAVSLPLGAVRLTEMFAASDPPSVSNLARLRGHIRERLTPVLDGWRLEDIDRVVATSGTARTVVSVINGLDRSRREEADRLSATTAEVAALSGALVGTTVEERSRIPGVGRRRAQVLVAGVAVLGEILAGLGMPTLHYSSAGLGDGIIAEFARGSRRDDPSEAADMLACPA